MNNLVYMKRHIPMHGLQPEADATGIRDATHGTSPAPPWTPVAVAPDGTHRSAGRRARNDFQRKDLGVIR